MLGGIALLARDAGLTGVLVDLLVLVFGDAFDKPKVKKVIAVHLERTRVCLDKEGSIKQRYQQRLLLRVW